ncbi:5'-3' DNA helicase ZGRF1 isoform X2 [Hydra vulgaris]|uniref:5'-3' DNA helicase ZGRF1 isoform X2 n=1 Tax=Hydra vulgaris TaxID=6087 RepID=UPI001F5F8E04|nr:protein ZGRF1 isoform X2 [Hydra vulgaris]
MPKYSVLYTHQKQKKQKTWQDGFLTVILENKKAVLLDSSGLCIDSAFLSAEQLCKGKELETEKFLITIESNDEESELKPSQELTRKRNNNKLSIDVAKKFVCVQKNIGKKDQSHSLQKVNILPESKSNEIKEKTTLTERKRSVCDIIALFNNDNKTISSVTSCENENLQQFETASFYANKKTRVESCNGSINDVLKKDIFFNKSIVSEHTAVDLSSVARFDGLPSTSESLNNQISLGNESENKHKPQVFGLSNSVNRRFKDLRGVSQVNSFSVPFSTLNSTLFFPSMDDIKNKIVTKRQIIIPTCFNSVTNYKQTFKAALMEHLNIVLFNIAKKYFEALACVDVSAITKEFCLKKFDTKVPSCKHGPAVMRTVKKDGKNHGRMFFSCSLPSQLKCNFFVWLEQVSNCKQLSVETKTPINDYMSAVAYFSSRGVELYFGVKFLRKIQFHSSKVSLYLLLPIKKAASRYNMGDLWIISKTLDFKRDGTFISKSVFYGPNSAGELEICPMSGYSRGNWSNEEICYAIQAYNASSELACCSNIDDFLNSIDVPVLKYLLESPFLSKKCTLYDLYKFDLPTLEVRELLNKTVCDYKLNQDQANALEGIADMFLKDDRVTLIHGVFGSGKSYLLSTVVVFLVHLFAMIESLTNGKMKMKLLVSSATNVAVDRVLQGLLDLGFENFIRVGSVKKIAKSILPYTVHASEEEDHELRELNDLLKTELSDKDKGYVRKAIEQHKLGVNRKKLTDVNVVGVTCAACVFPYLQKLEFKVQLLDECTQMTEPLCMLPIARFHCERLILVGDPKQLSPTIQGSESDHDMGLELTLFERMQRLFLKPFVLRTQYRCHPSISSICNKMFYDNMLLDGVTANDRQKLVNWLPTLSFIDVNGQEQCDFENSYSNVCEAQFVVNLLELIFETGIEPNQVGVITQYKSQVAKIASFLRESKSCITSSNLKAIQMSTVDAFQGAEKEIIILSCVRSRHIGFIDCPFRTNVALSRAKRHLVIAGNKKLLTSNACWNGVLNICNLEKAVIMSSTDFLKNINIRISE